MSREDAINQAFKDRERGYGAFTSFLSPTALDQWGLRQWKPKEGTNFIRIIPPPADNEMYALKLWIHFDVGAQGIPFVCMEAMTRGMEASSRLRCPICDALAKRKREQPDAKPEELSVYRPSLQFLCFVVDMSDPRTEQLGPQVFRAPKTVYEGMLSWSRDPRTLATLDLSHPERGYTFIFTRTGTGMTGTKYSDYRVEGPKAVKPEWLRVPSLLEVVHLPTYEEVAEAFLPPQSQQRKEAPQGGWSSSPSQVQAVDAVIAGVATTPPVESPRQPLAAPAPVPGPVQAEPVYQPPPESVRRPPVQPAPQPEPPAVGWENVNVPPVAASVEQHQPLPAPPSMGPPPEQPVQAPGTPVAGSGDPLSLTGQRDALQKFLASRQAGQQPPPMEPENPF